LLQYIQYSTVHIYSTVEYGAGNYVAPYHCHKATLKIFNLEIYHKIINATKGIINDQSAIYSIYSLFPHNTISQTLRRNFKTIRLQTSLEIYS
jgi:hypothetical protein